MFIKMSDAVGKGDGVSTSFGFYLPVWPIVQGSLIVGSDKEIFKDTGDKDGLMSSDEGGYGRVLANSGCVFLTFNTAPSCGAIIRAQFEFDVFSEGYVQDVLWKTIPAGLWDKTLNNYPILDSLLSFRDITYNGRDRTIITGPGNIMRFLSWSESRVDDERAF